MRMTPALSVFALFAVAASGCARHYIYGPAVGPGYYGHGHHRHGGAVVYQAQPVYQQQPVAYQQQPVVYQQPVAYQQQVVAPPPAVYEPQPVQLEQAPPAYYYQPTGHFRRPALYRGVRVYVAE